MNFNETLAADWAQERVGTKDTKFLLGLENNKTEEQEQDKSISPATSTGEKCKNIFSC